MENITKIFLMFIIYGFLGYIAEVVYVFILTKKLTNRGYLYGPIVPIYAFGALFIMLPLTYFEFGKFIIDRWYLVIIIGFILPTLLEYITSFVMEKIFHMRWWDYSDKFLNINGRVCLRNSTLFMLLVVLVVYVLNPLIIKFIDLAFNIEILAYIIAILLFIGLIVDFIFSTIKHVNIAKIISKLNQLKDKASDTISNKIDEAKELLNNYYNKFKEKLDKINIKYPSLKIIKNKNKISLKEFINKIKNKD